MKDDILSSVRGCYGAVRVRDLGVSGAQYRQVAALVDAGELIAHEHGVVSIPGTDRAVVLARIHGGLLTCGAAMHYYGLLEGDAAQSPHISIPNSGHFPPVGHEVLHIARHQDRSSPTSFPIQSPALALARYLRCQDREDCALIALDAALNRDLVTVTQIRALLRGPGSPRARSRLKRASARARSPLETLTRMDLERSGLAFEDGVDIEGVGEVDLVVEGRVVVELDGYTYHCDEHQFTLDRWRDRQLVARGYLPLRFTRREVHAHQVVPDLLRVLDRWGESGSAVHRGIEGAGLGGGSRIRM